jgi:hypothetical protein
VGIVYAGIVVKMTIFLLTVEIYRHGGEFTQINRIYG